jgi:DNA repair protein RAD50
MASINKLAIRGVRAFSPDDEEQVIDFGFPLTIIVGSNGCGKTSKRHSNENNLHC